MNRLYLPEGSDTFFFKALLMVKGLGYVVLASKTHHAFWCIFLVSHIQVSNCNRRVAKWLDVGENFLWWLCFTGKLALFEGAVTEIHSNGISFGRQGFVVGMFFFVFYLISEGKLHHFPYLFLGWGLWHLAQARFLFNLKRNLEGSDNFPVGGANFT